MRVGDGVARVGDAIGVGVMDAIKVVVVTIGAGDGVTGAATGGKLLATVSGARQESPYSMLPVGQDLSTGGICQTSFE